MVKVQVWSQHSGVRNRQTPLPKTMIWSDKIRPDEKHSPIFPDILGHCPVQTFSLPHSSRVFFGGVFKKNILNGWLWQHLPYFMYMLFCLYVCAPWACLVPARNQVPGTRTGVLGFLGTDGWELSWGFWEPNLNPLEEQVSVLNAKPFHQPLALFLTICTVYNCPSPGTLWLLLSPAVESQNTMFSSLQKKKKKNSWKVTVTLHS